MRFDFIIIKNNTELIFINTKPIIEINNRKLDKILSITFDNNLINNEEELKKYVKNFNI
jgi:hypothetical protein